MQIIPNTSKGAHDYSNAIFMTAILLSIAINRSTLTLYSMLNVEGKRNNRKKKEKHWWKELQKKMEKRRKKNKENKRKNKEHRNKERVKSTKKKRQNKKSERKRKYLVNSQLHIQKYGQNKPGSPCGYLPGILLPVGIQDGTSFIAHFFGISRF